MTWTVSETPQGIVVFDTQGPGQGIQFLKPVLVNLHVVGGGPAMTATGAVPSATVDSVVGTDIAGRVFFRTTAAGAGAQVLHTFSSAFATAPYVQVGGNANPSFEAGMPFVAASVNGFTVSMGVAPVVGASVSYNYLVIG